MIKKDFLDPKVTPIANCHTCGEMVQFGLEKCPNCGIVLDQEDIYPSVVVNFIITQAISSANSIRTFDVAVFFSLGVSLLRLGLEMPFWYNVVTCIPWLFPLIIIIRWFFKHGRWPITDGEYELAKKEMRSGFGLWLVVNGFNLIVLLILMMR